MTLYPFEIQVAVDANNPEVVVKSGTVTIYSPDDTSMVTPLTLLTPGGLPLPNPITTSAQGFTPAFQADIPYVMWTDGTYSGYAASYVGLLEQAQAARAAAEAAIVSGAPAGGTTGQVLTKTSGADYTMAWASPIVVIGPTDAWPTGLPEGTVVVRTGA